MEELLWLVLCLHGLWWLLLLVLLLLLLLGLLLEVLLPTLRLGLVQPSLELPHMLPLDCFMWHEWLRQMCLLLLKGRRRLVLLSTLRCWCPPLWEVDAWCSCTCRCCCECWACWML